MLPKVLLILAIILGAFWFLNQPKQAPIQSGQAQFASPVSLKSAEEYVDSELKFSFEYPAEYEVLEESEDAYSERTKTKYRKNFDYYVTYEPPKNVLGLVVKPKSVTLTEDQFAKVPLYIWIFENPDQLTADKWYAKYWYYPYLWGVYDSRKVQIEPSEDATVSGILTKSAEVSYSPGKPKLILLPKEDKMFLFKIMEGGENLLKGFKFL